MNFVYLCRNGENEELRYSIRSVVKNTVDPKIWVVGGRPSWYIGNYIPVRQGSTKYQNVINNLNAIVDSNDIPDDFTLMNDDFYITKPIDKIDSYHGGLFQNKVELFAKNVPESHYTRILKNTKDKLFDLGIDSPLDYAIHVPINLNKTNLSTVIEPGYSFRTLYGNIFNLGGTKIDDVKFHRKETRSWANNPDLSHLSTPFLSSSDSAFDEVYKLVLKDMLGSPTLMEKTKPSRI
jgi:hypothetical protein